MDSAPAPEPQTPGQLIARLLAERGWTQIVLSIVSGCTEQAVSEIVNGKRDLDAEMALRFGSVLGVEPERLLDLQKAFDLARARQWFSPSPDMSRRAALFSALPIREMLKRRWLGADDLKKSNAIEEDLCRFFGVENPESIPVLPHAAKKTGNDPTTPIQLAWLFRVQQLSRAMLAQKYSEKALRGAIKTARDLLVDPTDARHVPRMLLDCGVRFVVVESLPGSKIDGVCFWQDGSPVVGMSLRLDRIDNFWLVLRHELEHALLGHGRAEIIVDADMEQGEVIAEQERLANAAALEFCVPQSEMNDFYVRKRPSFYEKDIINFSRRIRVHPGLVAGQLRHRLRRWDLHRKHLVPVRSFVISSARVDGWGNVATVTA